MNKTQIEWVKNPDGTQGYTWNPITGCLNGCEYCYARKLANTRLKGIYLTNDNVAPAVQISKGWDVRRNNPFYPRLWENRFLTAYRGFSSYIHAKRKGIFVCDMSDLFGIGIPEDWTKRVLEQCRTFDIHRFYLLTKQPQNLAKFSPFPDNCWVGVSATDPPMIREAFKKLKQIEAKVKFISFEPLQGMIFGGDRNTIELFIKDADINWVIIGAQTKPYKPPKIEWVKEIVEACDKAGIPVFLKDNLAPMFDNLNNDRPNILESWWGKCNCFGINLRQEISDKEN